MGHYIDVIDRGIKFCREHNEYRLPRAECQSWSPGKCELDLLPLFAWTAPTPSPPDF